MRIALISCSKLKADHPCSARELYAPSQLFSLSYQYAKRNADKVYILSAKYGLVEETDVIAPYDLTLADLPEHRQRDWANYVLAQMGERFNLEHNTFLILAGRCYSAPSAPSAACNPSSGQSPHWVKNRFFAAADDRQKSVHRFRIPLSPPTPTAGHAPKIYLGGD